MSRGPTSAKRTVAAAAGTVAALFVLVGRWDLRRILDEEGPRNILVEPRFWLVVAAILIALCAKISEGYSHAKRGMPAPLFFLLAFFTWILASALWSRSVDMVAWNAYDVTLMGCFVALFAFTLSSTDPSRVLNAMWATITVVTAVLALVALVRTMTDGPERMAVLGGGPNVFGRLMALFLLGCLRLWRRGSQAFTTLSAAAAAFLLVVLSGSRGALLATVSALVAFFVAERIPVRQIITVGVVGTIVAAGVVLWTPVGRAVVSVYVERIVELSIEERYTSSRPELYEAALGLAVANPVIGVGLGGFATTGLHRYPHNLFLEVLSESGTVGLWLLVLTFGLAAFHIQRRLVPVDSASTAAFVFFFIASQFSGDLFDSRNVFVFLIALFYSQGGGTMLLWASPQYLGGISVVGVDGNRKGA